MELKKFTSHLFCLLQQVLFKHLQRVYKSCSLTSLVFSNVVQDQAIQKWKLDIIVFVLVLCLLRMFLMAILFLKVMELWTLYSIS